MGWMDLVRSALWAGIVVFATAARVAGQGCDPSIGDDGPVSGELIHTVVLEESIAGFTLVNGVPRLHIYRLEREVGMYRMSDGTFITVACGPLRLA